MIAQRIPIRLMIAANVLIWGWEIFYVELNVVLTIIIGMAALASRLRVSLAIFLIVISLSGYGLAAYYLGPCEESARKTVLSLALFSATLISLSSLVRIVELEKPILSIADTKVLLGIIVASVFVDALGEMSLASIGTHRVSGLFLEPSHLALTVVPLVLYLWFCGGKTGMLMAVVATLAILGLSYSSTFVISLLFSLISGYAFFARGVARIGLILMAVSVSTGLFYLLYGGASLTSTALRFQDILDLRRDSNLSSLVYGNGWELLKINADRTSWLGLGFNAMGCSPRPVTNVDVWLNQIGMGEQNYNDGSFLASKLISELGLFGGLLVAGAVFWGLKGVARVYSVSNQDLAVLSALWLFSLFIMLFVRSAGGYFSGPLLLALFAIMLVGGRRALKTRSNPHRNVT